MPANKPMPEKISEEMVLAAIDRAIRHSRLSETADVLLATVKEHLGLPRHGGATRQAASDLGCARARRPDRVQPSP